MKIRCVVTGHNPSGKAAIAKDAAIEPMNLRTLASVAIQFVTFIVQIRNCTVAGRLYENCFTLSANGGMGV